MPVANNTKATGERSEAAILARLLSLGYSVSIPFGNNQRYDMIVDSGSDLLRIQCKTGRLYGGCIVFATSSKNGFTNVRRHYRDDIDAFLVYNAILDRVYCIPIAAALPASEMRLRIEPLKSMAPKSTVRWAKDFEF